MREGRRAAFYIKCVLSCINVMLISAKGLDPQRKQELVKRKRNIGGDVSRSWRWW
ncbi:hypothetical protein KC19_2G238400 [Ceratodon purpureus]|uniref:Uncharacterized protein n=1 Tax=Ceratodon purpureus TaxID=3225 RepID=A0A8T0IYJ2_CERPU|nr:hypothetical protein KC19_2G238400 [Ceratodon purpureus]